MFICYITVGCPLIYAFGTWSHAHQTQLLCTNSVYLLSVQQFMPLTVCTTMEYNCETMCAVFMCVHPLSHILYSIQHTLCILHIHIVHIVQTHYITIVIEAFNSLFSGHIVFTRLMQVHGVIWQMIKHIWKTAGNGWKGKASLAQTPLTFTETHRESNLYVWLRWDNHTSIRGTGFGLFVLLSFGFYCFDECFMQKEDIIRMNYD